MQDVTDTEKVDKQRRPDMWRLAAKLAVGALAAVALLGALSLWHASIVYRTRVEEPDMDTIAQICGVRFPPGAKLIHSHLAREWDTYKTLLAEVAFDRKYVDEWCKTGFTSSEGKTIKVSDTDRVLTNAQGESHDVDAPEWWTPDSVREFVFLEASTVSDQVLVLVSLDDPMIARAYIYKRGSYEVPAQEN